jgi:hypothetical protein
MNRKDFYFRQKVKASELDAAFEDVDFAFASFLQGFGYVGIAAGAEVTENSPTNLTVLVAGPSIIYDQNQKHIQWAPNQVVNCALDESGASTAVPTVAFERWLSIFAEYDEVLSDPRVDGDGDTVYFSRSESFALNVVQGAEASAGAATRPPLRGDQILLADVKLVNGQTAIINASISTTRAQVTYDLSGTPFAIKQRGLQAALQAMLDELNGFDASTVAADAISDSPLSLAAGSVEDQTTELLAHVNVIKEELAAAQNVSAKYVLGSSAGNGDPVPIAAETMDNGGFILSSDQVQVPAPGVYLLALTGSCNTTSVSDPAALGVHAQLITAGIFCNLSLNRWNANPGTSVAGTGVGLVEITDPATEKLEVIADNDLTNIFVDFLIVRLGP